VSVVNRDVSERPKWSEIGTVGNRKWDQSEIGNIFQNVGIGNRKKKTSQIGNRKKNLKKIYIYAVLKILAQKPGSLV
jgi:hypothetical protein